ncbi:hypothetical protein [Actinotalea sp. C106]|uniref:hypothetical protein n=1 Tax=Actinotalea sp. C106 TaxID=2908644 RepID=UPI0020284755|nr:hypothetical protein [Actinotalea sp. C106]
MKFRTLTAGACAGVLVAAGASAAVALEGPVDIEVLVADADGEFNFFYADGVTPGDGVELTADDLDTELSGAGCGAVEVDVDPEAQTVTITAVEEQDGPCLVNALGVVLYTDEISELSLVSDGLLELEGEPAEADVDYVVETVVGEDLGDVELDLDTDAAAVLWLTMAEPLSLTGSSVLSYELLADEVPEEEPVDEEPPAAEAPAEPARPVVAQPTFTG